MPNTVRGSDLGVSLVDSDGVGNADSFDFSNADATGGATEAIFDNFVSFYEVVDENGGIDASTSDIGQIDLWVGGISEVRPAKISKDQTFIDEYTSIQPTAADETSIHCYQNDDGYFVCVIAG